MLCVKNVVHMFCGMSGQQGSSAKTGVMFLKNVSREVRDKLERLSGFWEVADLGKYLGVPLLGRAHLGKKITSILLIR